MGNGVDHAWRRRRRFTRTALVLMAGATLLSASAPVDGIRFLSISSSASRLPERRGGSGEPLACFIVTGQTKGKSKVIRGHVRLGTRRGEGFDLFGDEEKDGYFEDEDGDSEARGGRRRVRTMRREDDGLGNGGGDGLSFGMQSPSGKEGGLRLPLTLSQTVLLIVFMLGIAFGVALDSQVNTNPKDLASRDAIDRNAPSPLICSRFGASAMAFDTRVFVSFNPFNVFVSQTDVKPGCVLRRSNVVPLLKDQGLLNEQEVRSCRNNMNTWAFVGDLDDKPQLSCVYKSEDAQNEFLSNPKYGIGEDVYDDDRAREAAEAAAKATGKLVKSGMTAGQRDMQGAQLGTAAR